MSTSVDSFTSEKFYWLVRGATGLAVRILGGARVSGSRHIPAEGPVILCSNHFSYWDPPAVAAACPRRVFFMAKKELFSVPVLGPAVRLLGAFPVDRQSADRGAIRQALRHLKEGRVLGLFPEGTRGQPNQVSDPKPGVGLIAKRSRAPVVPMAVIGEYVTKDPVHVRVGEPLTWEDLTARAGSSQMGAVSRQIMEEVKQLMNRKRGI